MLSNAPKPTACALTLALVLNGSIALAQNTAPENEPEIVTLEAGDVAPFTGDLFPPARSIRLGLRLETCQEKAEIQLRHAVRIYEIDLEYEKRVGAERLKAEQMRREATERALAEGLAWYRSPTFVAAVSIVLTLGAVSVVAYSVGQIPGR